MAEPYATKMQVACVNEAKFDTGRQKGGCRICLPVARATEEIPYPLFGCGEIIRDSLHLLGHQDHALTFSGSRAWRNLYRWLSELAQTPLGSRVICELRDLLYEEAPMAYKPIKTVIKALEKAGLVKVIATLRPVLTYKTRAVRR